MKIFKMENVVTGMLSLVLFILLVFFFFLVHATMDTTTVLEADSNNVITIMDGDEIVEITNTPPEGDHDAISSCVVTFGEEEDSSIHTIYFLDTKMEP